VNKTLLLLIALALLATWAAWHKDPSLPMKGATSAAKLFLTVIPNIVVAFFLAGMVMQIMPRDVVASYMGEDSGFLGLAIATGAGAITPGGPFVQFPLVAALWKSGTGVGPITAYLTSWALLGFQRILVWEAPIMGWKYALIRSLACLAAPFLVGWLTAVIYRNLG